MTFESIPHPRTKAEDMLEIAHLNELAEAGFHGDKTSFDAIHKELAQMFPVERRAVLDGMDGQTGLSTERTAQTEESHIVPSAKVARDTNGDLSSITFTDNDVNKGASETIDLNDKNTSDGADTKRYQLPDGEMRVATFDANNKPIQIQDSDGSMIAATGNGTYLRSDRDNSINEISNLQLKADGSVSYSYPGHEDTLNVTEKTDSNGDRTKLVETTLPDGSKVDVSLVDHKDGSSSRIDATGRIDSSDNDNHLTIHPISGGTVNYDLVSADPFKCVMSVEFPDGFKKSFDDVTPEEYKKIKDEPAVPKVEWKADHHFAVLTHEPD
jgi:hypothetical protein